MSKPELILIGAGGHARACIDAIEQQGKYHIAGLVGTPQDMGTEHLGYAVMANDDDLFRLVGDYRYAFIAVGQIGVPEIRLRLYLQVLSLGFELPVIVAPSAYVSRHAVLGAGTVVMHGAIVNAGARVGNNCIINSNALLEHDATVGEHCHISTGAILNGNASIGSNSFVGSGSVIKEGVRLGKNCVVGMLCCVRHNQADGTRYVGTGQA
jgi:sugar O-acyltransferase (sialic acid O-acetyltransferase NeuD family)